MKFERMSIPDVVLMRPEVFGDERGFFLETFRQSAFDEHCGSFSFVQDNLSRSSQGILRGLHYQNPRPQGKLVQVVRGEVFDVAVDLRRSSPSFGRWAGARLTATAHELLWVPPGFAHGFYVISELAEVTYKCTDYYAPEFERSLRWDAPGLHIPWPLIEGAGPMLSDKDAKGSTLSEVKSFA